MQSLWTLREAMTKKGRCRVFGNGPLTFPRLLDVVADAAIVARARDTGLVFRKCGEKLKTAEHNPIFGNKTAGRGSTKQGSGRLVSVLPRTSEIACRKYAANSGTPERTAIFAQRNRR